MKPLTDKEIHDLLSETMHGPPPHKTLMRIYATLAEVPTLRASVNLHSSDPESRARALRPDQEPK